MPQIESIKSRRKAKKSSGVRLPFIKKQPSRQASGKILEIQYFRIIKDLIEPYFEDIRERLIPSLPAIVEGFEQQTRVDDTRLDQTYGEIITRRIRDIQIGIALQIPDPRVKARSEDQANNINRFNRNQFDRQITTVLGVNPILNESWLEPQVSSFVEGNVSLIQNIPEQSLRNIETKLRAGIEQGVSAKELQRRTLEEVMTKRLEDLTKDELKKANNRAKLIARDQTNKFMGKLTELRQTSLGVEEYIWSTSRDERVRPTHRSKEGKTFSWDDPPSDTGHPGSDIACRCVAIPVLDNFK